MSDIMAQWWWEANRKKIVNVEHKKEPSILSCSIFQNSFLWKKLLNYSFLSSFLEAIWSTSSFPWSHRRKLQFRDFDPTASPQMPRSRLSREVRGAAPDRESYGVSFWRFRNHPFLKSPYFKGIIDLFFEFQPPLLRFWSKHTWLMNWMGSIAVVQHFWGDP